MSTQTLEPVQRAVTVAAAPERAFEVFTRELGSWWPFDPHSITGGPDEMVFEEREGGEVYELKDGERLHWAFVTAWDPPRRFAVEWKVNPDAAAPTDVEVTFVPDGDGTRVTLVHSGWERLGEEAAADRESYSGGWVRVLGRYESHLNG